VYIVGNDGRIKDRITIHCDDDEKAKIDARALVDGRAVELWQESRRVAVFQPE